MGQEWNEYEREIAKEQSFYSMQGTNFVSDCLRKKQIKMRAVALELDAVDKFNFYRRKEKPA